MAGPAPTTLTNHEDRSAGPVHSSGWLCPDRNGLDGDDFKVNRAARIDARDHHIPKLIEQCLAVRVVVVVSLQPEQATVPPACHVLMPELMSELLDDIGGRVRGFRVRQTAAREGGVIEGHNGSAFNGRRGTEPRCNHKDRSRAAGPLQCVVIPQARISGCERSQPF